MKKTLSILLFILTVVGSLLFININSNVNALELTPKLIEGTKTSEFSKVQSLKISTDSKLKSEGYTDAQIIEIRDFDFGKAIKERSIKYNNVQLKSMGYTDNQINIMRDFKGTDVEIMALSSTLTLNIWNSGATAGSSFSSLNASMNWSWSTQPLWELTDIIAFSWSGGYSSGYSSTLTANYVYAFDSSKVIKKDFPLLSSNIIPGAGCFFKIPMQYSGNADYMARSGSGTVYLNKYAYVGSAQVLCKYGHRQLVGSAVVRIPSGLSISFNIGTNEEAVKTFNYPSY